MTLVLAQRLGAWGIVVVVALLTTALGHYVDKAHPRLHFGARMLVRLAPMALTGFALTLLGVRLR